MKLLSPTLNPLTELYFAEEVEGRDAAKGNRTTTWTLLSIAVLILAVAFINFVNFFFALIPVRIRAINIGKIFGAPQWKLRIGLLFETAGLIFSAAVIAFGLAVIFADTPLAAYLTAPIFAEWRLAAGLLALALATGVAASLYPAWYLTRFPPLLVVTGSFRATDAGRRLRYLLVGVQYTIALVLIAATLTIHRQHRYMMRYDMGFDREELYSVTVPQEALPNFERRDALIGQLRANPEVAEVAAADGEIVAPERNGWGYTDPETGKLNLFNSCRVSWNFLEMMEINLLDGRQFVQTDEAADGELFIANETAKRQFGLTLKTQFPSSDGSTSRMIGFCEDFHFKPMQFGLEPFLFTVSRRSKPVPNHLYIRMAAGVATDRARDCIRRTILGFDPSIEPERIEPRFIDEELESNYQQERKLSTLVLLFSMLSILIAMMGVFGLVLFETQCRRREIGIRRVNGATVGEILALFNRQFLRIVLLCAVVAIPAGYAILDRWLSQFAYRTPIAWWIFVAAFAVVTVITVATVTARSWHAATENPSHVMKANN